MAKAKNKKGKVKLSPEEKLKREHRGFARLIFHRSGFVRLEAASDKQFTFKGVTSDFDDVFLRENVLVICEYTVKDEAYVSTHLKKKSFVYAAIEASPADLISFLKTQFPSVTPFFQNNTQMFILR